MQEVVLVIHLILAVTIIGLVLLQRSSGGGLGVGGGGGMGDFASARSTANALTKATTICAFLFFATSLSLAVLAKSGSAKKGLLDEYQTQAPVTSEAPAADPAAVAPAPVPAAEGAAPVSKTSEPPVSTE